jgi:hypothetical protein
MSGILATIALHTEGRSYHFLLRVFYFFPYKIIGPYNHKEIP